MTEQAISPLRRRMIEDMTIRKFAEKTQHDYVRRVKEFVSYLKRSPDTWGEASLGNRDWRSPREVDCLFSLPRQKRPPNVPHGVAGRQVPCVPPAHR
jgi:hypothetical protein